MDFTASGVSRQCLSGGIDAQDASSALLPAATRAVRIILGIAGAKTPRSGCYAGAKRVSGLLWMESSGSSGDRGSGVVGLFRRLHSRAPDFERIPAGRRLLTARELLVRRGR